jgi:hypothetical protein
MTTGKVDREELEASIRSALELYNELRAIILKRKTSVPVMQFVAAYLLKKSCDQGGVTPLEVLNCLGDDLESSAALN